MSVAHSWPIAALLITSACGGVPDTQVMTPAPATTSAPAPNAVAQPLSASSSASVSQAAVVAAGAKEANDERVVAQTEPTAATFLSVGDATEPQRVFERFLALALEDRLDSDEGRALVAPKFDSSPKAKGGERPSFTAIVRIDATHAVARLTHRIKPPEYSKRWKKPPPTPPVRHVDWYWYLEDADGWRVTAARALAQTGLLEMAAQFGADITKYDAEATKQVQNARLTLKSDAELARWFTEHRAALDEIVELVRSAPPDRPLGAREDEKVKAAVKRLYLTSADQLANGDIEITVGGITDNSVIFRLPADGKLPHISDRDVIWAEALGSGWFLVKTT